MTEIISIANQKGGCGKTTTAVNLSAGLALYGMKTLLVDMDPQGNSSLTFGVNIEDILISMTDILLDPEMEMKYNIFQRGHIHVAPSNPTLNYAEERLHSMTENVFRLREKLEQVKGYYDYIIIDCPPNIGILTTNALVASRWIIVPIDIGYYSLVGIKQLLARVEDVKSALRQEGGDGGPDIMGILITQFQKRGVLAREISDKVREGFAGRVFETVIRRDVRLAEAPSHLNSIFEYEWNCGGAEDYLNLAREVMECKVEGTALATRQRNSTLEDP